MKYLLIFLLSINLAHAKTESDYVKEWCVHGEVEYRLPDKTRVDCLTEFAIEFDYPHKWAEAIGQALHYGVQTNRRGGIVLIMRKQSDLKYWKRMQDIIWQYRLPIQTYMMWVK